jgi:hypothetical protein
MLLVRFVPEDAIDGCKMSHSGKVKTVSSRGRVETILHALLQSREAGGVSRSSRELVHSLPFTVRCRLCLWHIWSDLGRSRRDDLICSGDQSSVSQLLTPRLPCTQEEGRRDELDLPLLPSLSSSVADLSHLFGDLSPLKHTLPSISLLRRALTWTSSSSSNASALRSSLCSLPRFLPLTAPTQMVSSRGSRSTILLSRSKLVTNKFDESLASTARGQHHRRPALFLTHSHPPSSAKPSQQHRLSSHTTSFMPSYEIPPTMQAIVVRPLTSNSSSSTELITPHLLSLPMLPTYRSRRQADPTSFN